MTTSLDSEQQAIVDYDGSQVIIAGPGSGKTRTLVAKAEDLYQREEKFICLTFTRAAAAEMRDRMPGVDARTIHSYCRKMSGGGKNYDKMLTGFLEAKRTGYLQEEKYDWVLVDEVQDLTDVQWRVVKSIVGGKLFAVGDPYQSIYGWNGALGDKIFTELDSLGCKTFHLNNNYRSSPEIVELLESKCRRGLVSKGTKNLGTTAILARARSEVARVARLLDREDVGYTVRLSNSELSSTKEVNHGSSTLRVMTMHCSKGLEFDRVLLYCYDMDYFNGRRPGSEEMNLYYVALARASKVVKELWSPESLLTELTKKE
jgi:superfamily I DNA/RNA helicase